MFGMFILWFEWDFGGFGDLLFIVSWKLRLILVDAENEVSVDERSSVLLVLRVNEV